MMVSFYGKPNLHQVSLYRDCRSAIVVASLKNFRPCQVQVNASASLVAPPLIIRKGNWRDSIVVKITLRSWQPRISWIGQGWGRATL